MKTVHNIEIDKLFKILSDLRKDCTHVDIKVNEETKEITISPSTSYPYNKTEPKQEKPTKLDSDKNLSELI